MNQEKKSMENLTQMGLDLEHAKEISELIKPGKEDFLARMTDTLVKHGDMRLYSELVHTSHFPRDIANIMEATAEDAGAIEFFGLDTADASRLESLNYVGLGHDLSLMMGMEGLSNFMDLEAGAARLGDPNKRFVGDHHRRSKVILAGIMENHLEKQVYNALLDIMELSSVKLAKEEVAGLQKTGRLYQTIPMIVDGVAHTGENRARYISETPFIEDMLLAYAAGKVTAEDALKEVNFYADDVNGMGAKLTQPVKFDHAKMAARLAKKKNFPFLDQVKAKFPNVYEAIVTAGENKELERALSHPMYRIGVDAGIQVCEDALNQQDITRQDDLAHAVERLGQTIQKYQPMFTGGK